MKVGLALAAAMVFAAAMRASADPLPMDTPLSIDGIDTVCTGVGSDKDDPRWQSYPVRVEFSNGAAQYLAGAHVALSARGRSLASFDCAGSWVLLRLPPGKYSVTAALSGEPDSQPHTTTFTTAGGPGQQRVEVQFPRMAANE
jgi:hypothetical protein